MQLQGAHGTVIDAMSTRGSRALLLLVCAACAAVSAGPSNETGPADALTKPAACQRVPQTDALAREFGALQQTWPVLSAGQYGALILFGTCILTWALLRAQSYGSSGAAPDAPHKIGLAVLANPASVLQLAQEAAEASAIFLFAFACEYFPFFASTERTWNAVTNPAAVRAGVVPAHAVDARACADERRGLVARTTLPSTRSCFWR